MGDNSTVVALLQYVALPAFTAVGGWFASLWRNRQKKEQDVLSNVKQIIDIQKKYIEEQQATIVETKNINKRIEAKLDKKAKAIRKANWCKYTNEGDGCPVLNEEERLERDDDNHSKCETCIYQKSEA